MNRYVQRAGFVVAGGVLVAGLAAAPAMASAPTVCPTQAQTDPNNTNANPGDGVPGGACEVQGTITVPSALTLYTDLAPFTLSTQVGSFTSSPPSNAIVDAGHFEIQSNVPTGYYLDEQGPVNGFTNGVNAPVPDTDVASGVIQGGGEGTPGVCPTSGWMVLPHNPVAVLQYPSTSTGALTCATGGYTAVNSLDDTFNFPGFYLISFNGSAAGSYTGTVEFALWGT